MQRTSWAGGKAHSDAEEARNRAPSHSKAPRRQGLSREWRLAWQQRRLPGPIVVLLLVLACFAIALWGMGLQFSIYDSTESTLLLSTADLAGEYHQQLDQLIERTEAERQQALAELQPAFKDWQNLKAEAATARERLRESKADLERVEELHRQRLNTLAASAVNQDSMIQYGKHQESADQLKQEWDEERNSALEALKKASEQEKEVGYQENKTRHLVEVLRQDVQAMGAALAEYVEQKSSDVPKQLRGTRWPGNVFDRKLLLDVFKRNLDGLARKRSLRDQQVEERASEVLRSLPQAVVSSPEASSEASDTQQEGFLDLTEQHALSHAVGGVVSVGAGQTLGDDAGSGFEAHLQTDGAGAARAVEQLKAASPSLEALEGLNIRSSDLTAASGFEAHPQSTGQDTRHQDEATKGEVAVKPDEAAGITQVGAGGSTGKVGRSRAMLPELDAAKAAEGKQNTWLSDAWAGKGNGITGPDDVDSSLRCEKSGICEGIASCKAGLADTLGCITNNAKRQEAVQEAARWSWEAYKKYAFGYDELLPLSQTSNTWFDLGLTLVDALDTLLLLGLEAEYEEARNWVAEDLKVDPDKAVNLFETTIRVVGGLLAAFHLSNGDMVMLYKAASLSLRLLPAFGSATGIPYSDVNLHTHSAEQPRWTAFSSLSEVTSLAVEFTFLARASGEQEPMQKALAAVHAVLGMRSRVQGLAPIYVDIASATLQGHMITLGARGDSYYEYLLKQWLISGKKDDALLKAYEEAMKGVRNLMLMRTDHDGLLFVAELSNGGKSPKMDHLVCFLPGLLALGHHHGVNTASEGEPDDLEVAEDLMRTCYEMYRRTPTGLAPEIAFFKSSAAHAHLPAVHNDAGGGDFIVKPHDAHNLLRPETMESLFLLWRVTGKPHFQEWAWAIFRAFQLHTRVEGGGYADLDSCLEVPPPKRDKMESFWLAETLKYLYLTLDASNPQLLSLDEYVFNTEAHPLPVESSMADISSGHAYEAQPYAGQQNLTLDARIQYWEDLAKEAIAVRDATQ